MAAEEMLVAAAAEPLEALVRLNLSGRTSGRTLVRLRERFGGLAPAFAASEQALLRVPGMGPKLVAAIRASTPGAAAREMERAAREGIQLIGLGHAGYPPQLAALDDPPLVLYVRGGLRADLPLVAVVGSRRATPYGRRMAQRLAAGLAEAQVGVVSGLARGIDACAHLAALQAGGYTVAVLGCGLDHVYPPEHRLLLEQLAHRGAVLSELPLGTPPRGYQFPRRNRVVAGLVGAVCVVEAAARSGSLITASWALELGREVLAVPARVGDPNAEGVLGLLRDGAGVACEPADILRAVGLPVRSPAVSPPGAPTGPLDEIERGVLAALGTEVRYPDELIESTAFAPTAVLAALTRLELKALVQALPGGAYQACTPLAPAPAG
ncbi:MAG: DNA polymerase [Planctomycetota bacterium]|nr:MAG: DNA polymerase [Planctomycetota bacterium]